MSGMIRCIRGIAGRVLYCAGNGVWEYQRGLKTGHHCYCPCSELLVLLVCGGRLWRGSVRDTGYPYVDRGNDAT